MPRLTMSMMLLRSAVLVASLAACGEADSEDLTEEVSEVDVSPEELIRRRVRRAAATPVDAAVPQTPLAVATAPDASLPITRADAAVRTAPDANVSAAPVVQGSGICPNNNGSCIDKSQNRLVCVDNDGLFSCEAPAGANICPDGQICPTGTVCGLTRACISEGGGCFFYCIQGGGPVVVRDGAVGGPCARTDVHGVEHLCSTGLCSGGSQSTCLPPRNVQVTISNL